MEQRSPMKQTCRSHPPSLIKLIFWTFGNFGQTEILEDSQDFGFSGFWILKFWTFWKFGHSQDFDHSQNFGFSKFGVLEI